MKTPHLFIHNEEAELFIEQEQIFESLPYTTMDNRCDKAD